MHRSEEHLVSTSDDDRSDYLSGERVSSPTARERAELEELRTVLDMPAAWVEPDPGLEDRVVSAIAAEARSRRADVGESS
jgi:hypothetical protein